MKSKIFLAVLIVVLVIGVTFFIRINQNNYVAIDTTGNNLPGQTQNSTTEKISLTELANHNSLEDCWIAYKGKVYDITSFLPRHPGSAGAILPYCGSATEFEQAFTKQHGTSKVSMLMKVGTFIGDFDVMGNLQN